MIFSNSSPGYRLTGQQIFKFAIAGLLFLLATNGSISNAQDDSSSDSTDESNTAEVTEATESLVAPEKVDIAPTADDTEIENRLLRILQATEWFENEKVEVDEGVVFLSGSTGTEEHRKWASQLASKTQDVVAVVNRIKVTQRSIWDLTPAWNEIDKLGRETVQSLPMLAVAMVILFATWLVSTVTATWSRFILRRRMTSTLLVDVAARAVTLLTWLIGIYLALRVSGLTQVAATLIGGTGLIGLIVGIAFRDIAENFLASILISIQRPFALGDVVEIEGTTGSVQSVTMHGTLLMTMDGNHVQMPNSVVYKSTIQNLSVNPNVRQQFQLGIGYDDSITLAQSTILKVLQDHSVVLESPEPIVLVDALGSSTVNLTVYFWIDAIKHSKPKVRSSVIRKVKQAVEAAGISMPDEAREVIVPKPIPVQMLQNEVEVTETTQAAVVTANESPASEDESESTAAEGGLDSEIPDIEEQARTSRPMESNANLLAN